MSLYIHFYVQLSLYVTLETKLFATCRILSNEIHSTCNTRSDRINICVPSAFTVTFLKIPAMQFYSKR
jgi:hypothetical protein